jgi:hypothetical protein
MPSTCHLQGLVLTIKWDSFAVVPHIDHPILFIAGKRDQVSAATLC